MKSYNDTMKDALHEFMPKVENASVVVFIRPSTKSHGLELSAGQVQLLKKIEAGIVAMVVTKHPSTQGRVVRSALRT